MSAVRTAERGYYAGTRRAGQVRRVHVLREVDGPGEWRAGSRFWCGQGAWDVTHSPAIIRETPHGRPSGLTWCGHCLGKLAEHMGRLDEVARLLGVGNQATVCARPRLHGFPLPDLAHVQLNFGRGEVLAVDELLDALPADAPEHAADLCRPD